MGLIKLFDKSFDQILCLLIDLCFWRLIGILSSSFGFELVLNTDVWNIVDRVNNLSDLLRIFILFVNLIFEVLLKYTIFGWNHL
jgi:hypothetical protein